MAVPLHDAVKYVAAAFVLVALYLTIMGWRVARLEREVTKLNQR